jgi:hypothetical protein
MVAQPKGIEEGIYSSKTLSNEAYHEDPALSHSGMTKVLVSWPDYWMTSVLNPQRKRYTATDAMIFGQRAGMLLLEPDVFYKSFNTAGRAPNAKAMFLSSVEYERLVEGQKAVMEVPIGKDHLTQGYPEVSIFFNIDGVRVRVRIDYLRTFGCIDYKRIAELNNWGIGKAVKNQGLDIQHFLYLEAVKWARLWIKRMKPEELTAWCQREGFDEGWMCDFRDDQDLLFRFLFQRSTPPYIWGFRDLEPEVVVEGAHAVFTAVKRYRKGLELYGTGRPPLGENNVKTVSQYHVPRRDYDYEE